MKWQCAPWRLAYSRGVHRTFIDLPAAVFALAPELATAILPDESHATCESCVMLGEEHGAGAWPPWAFSAQTRCCTYVPPLPNFIVGRALRRGGEGAELMRRRLADADGRTPWGAEQPSRSRAPAPAERFGRDVALRCPYWSTSAGTCGVWPDRGAVCRTWYCRLDEGQAGQRRWKAVSDTLTAVWETLARYCVALGDAPPADAAVEDWIAWYLACAERVDRATREDLAPHVSDELAARDATLVAAPFEPTPRLPERLASVFKQVPRPPGRLWVSGHTPRDGVTLMPEVVAQVEALAGDRPWRDALAQSPDVDERLVAELFRMGALVDAGEVVVRAAPRTDVPLPERVAVRVRRIEETPGGFRLHSSASPEPVSVPKSIFTLLSKLDGRTPWRDALAAARTEGASDLDEAIVGAMWERGVLVVP